MSPSATFLLTLMGVLLVGIPLPLLTGKAGHSPIAEPVECTTDTETCYAVIQFTGLPGKICIRHSGGDWKVIDTSRNLHEFELELPKQSRLELEIQAEWEDSSLQAVSLTLEPSSQEAQMKTLWKEAGGSTLHDIMTFTW